MAIALVAVVATSLVAHGAISKLALTGSTEVEQSTISVFGMGTVAVKPDRALVILGVETIALTAKEALEKNSAITKAVIEALKGLGIKEKDIRTRYFSVYPEYAQKTPEGPLELIRYRASYSLEVTLKVEGIDGIDDMIDAAASAGPNRIEGVRFAISEELQAQLRREAIEKAVNEARSRALQVLGPLGLKILGVKSISISEHYVPMPLAKELVLTIPERPPIIPGEAQYTVVVQIVYVVG